MILGERCRSEDLVAIESGADHVIAHHVHEVRGVVHRLDVVEIERIDLGEVVEHGTEPTRRLGEFVVAECESGQLGHLAHVVGGDSVGHGPNAIPSLPREVWRFGRSGSRLDEPPCDDAFMTPRETLIAIAGPTGDIGAHFYFHPATVAAGRELGLDSFKFYVLGRGGVLGDVPAAVMSSAFGYFNPATIGPQWDKARAIVSPPVAAQAAFDECGKRGSEALSAIDGLEAYVEAADIVIDHANIAGLPLFAGIAQMTCAVDDIAARAMQKAAVLRELRGSVHLCAVLASGLTDAQAHAIQRPGDVASFGWEEAPELPIDAQARMDAAEELTNTMLERAFLALTGAQSDALVAGTRAIHAAIT